MNNVKICVICGKAFEGYGNNPIPVMPYGRCCDECNTTYVIPTRLKEVQDVQTKK